MSDFGAKPRRIAALLFKRVGDSLLATAALRALKQHDPRAEIIAFSEPQAARVFANNPVIDVLVTLDRSPTVVQLARALRRACPLDATLDFLSDPRSAIACLCSGADKRIGIAARGRSLLYTDCVPRQNPLHPVYSAQHKLGLVKCLGIIGDDLRLDFFLADSDLDFAENTWRQRHWEGRSKVAAFFINSRRSHKRWPLHYFAKVIQQLQRTQQITPAILVTPGDEAVVAELARQIHLPDQYYLKIDDLGKLGAVLKKCALFIGNDGGPKHIAVALGTPTVTIFGADSAIYWTPPDSNIHLALQGHVHDSTGDKRILWPDELVVADAVQTIFREP